MLEEGRRTAEHHHTCYPKYLEAFLSNPERERERARARLPLSFCWGRAHMAYVRRNRSEASARLSDAEGQQCHLSADRRRSTEAGIQRARIRSRWARTRFCLLATAGWCVLFVVVLLLRSTTETMPAASSVPLLTAKPRAAKQGMVEPRAVKKVEARKAGEQPRYQLSRFAAGMLDAADARASLQRVVAAMTTWLSERAMARYGHGPDGTLLQTFLLLGDALKAAHLGEAGLRRNETCVLGMRSGGFNELLRLLRAASTNSLSRKIVRNAFPGGILEDTPWNARSRFFPEFHGELWASVEAGRRAAQTDEEWVQEEDKVREGGFATMRGIGWLHRPAQPCVQVSMVDSATGVHCTVLPLEEEGGASVFELRAKGGPHVCATAEQQHSGCVSTACFRFASSIFEGLEPCDIFGAPAQCPHDRRAVLQSFFSEG